MTALDTTRAEWLEWRRGGIGGSDVAALVGLSKWSSPWSIWADKCGLVPGDVEGTEAMDFGRRAESMMAGYFHDRTGLYVAGEQTWCSNPDEPWMRCTVDGFVFEREGGVWAVDDALGVAEWKTTDDSAKEWETNGIPSYYAAQGQWSMAVTGMPVAWFGVLHLAFGHPQFRVYELHRDEADIALLKRAAGSFWFDHVLTGDPPPTDGSEATERAIASVWPEQAEGEQVDLDEVAGLIELRATAKVWEKTAEAEIKIYDNALAVAFGSAEVGCVDGVPVLTYKAQTRKATCSECGHVDESEPFRVFRAAPKAKGKK